MTIENSGRAETGSPFWVDLYFNPVTTPSVNHPWNTIASRGAVWGVTKNLAPGESLVLTTGAGDPYWSAQNSSPRPWPVNARVYALADSINFNDPAGAVVEADEGNNVFGPVVSRAGAAAGDKAAARGPDLDRLPER